MCILFVKETGAPLPKDEYLINSFVKNPDGAGYAFVREGKIHIRKGFQSAHALIKDLRAHFPEDAPGIIHFRLATHGPRDKVNAHPFPLSRHKPTFRITRGAVNVPVLAHNGVFSLSPPKGMSDTAYVAWTLAPFRNKLRSRDYARMLNVMFAGNKVAILFPDGEIWMWGTFSSVEGTEGLWASNESYKSLYQYARYRRAGYTAGYYGGAYYDHEEYAVVETPTTSKQGKLCENCEFVLPDVKYRPRYGLYMCDHCYDIHIRGKRQTSFYCEFCGKDLTEEDGEDNPLLGEERICKRCADLFLAS